MDDYIVHIYRRNPLNTKELVGLVELVESEEQQAFHNMQELWSILVKETHKEPNAQTSSNKHR